MSQRQKQEKRVLEDKSTSVHLYIVYNGDSGVKVHVHSSTDCKAEVVQMLDKSTNTSSECLKKPINIESSSDPQPVGFSTPSPSACKKVQPESQSDDIDSEIDEHDDSSSTTSLESYYEMDPDAPEGTVPQSQPCYRRGIHYTPLGLKKMYRKKRKLFDSEESNDRRSLKKMYRKKRKLFDSEESNDM